jgi:hypothetical protein
MKNIQKTENKVELQKVRANKAYDRKLAKLAAAAPLFRDDENRAY